MDEGNALQYNLITSKVIDQKLLNFRMKKKKKKHFYQSIQNQEIVMICHHAEIGSTYLHTYPEPSNKREGK